MLLRAALCAPRAGISPPGAAGSTIFGGGRADGGSSFFVRGGSVLRGTAGQRQLAGGRYSSDHRPRRARKDRFSGPAAGPAVLFVGYISHRDRGRGCWRIVVVAGARQPGQGLRRPHSGGERYGLRR